MAKHNFERGEGDAKNDKGDASAIGIVENTPPLAGPRDVGMDRDAPDPYTMLAPSKPVPKPFH
jgi:hypothetical protein